MNCKAALPVNRRHGFVCLGVEMKLKGMKSYCQLKPGQNGTKRLVEQYGKALLCVRYRYDETRRIRVKTVELNWQQTAMSQ